MNKELAEKGSRVEEIMETKKGTEIKKKLSCLFQFKNMYYPFEFNKVSQL